MKTKNLDQLALNGVEAAEGAPKVIDFNEGKTVTFEATASTGCEAKPKVLADGEQTVAAAKRKISRSANWVNEFRSCLTANGCSESMKSRSCWEYRTKPFAA